MNRLLVLLVLFTGSAFADTVTVSWQNATKNTDGSDIVASGPGSLVQTTIYYSKCVNGDLASDPPARVVAPSVLETDFDLSEPADWCFRGTHTNTYGQESEVSNLAVKAVAPPIPDPPQNLVVLASNLAAYAVETTHNRVNVYQVGFVPAGTACDTSMSVNGRYVVPIEAVQWPPDSNVRPEAVVAECGSGG